MRMKDRFKFRAWNPKKEIMVYGNEDDSAEYWDGSFGSDVEMVNSRLSWSLSDYIWMQCTGLKDKAGKLIYEGDIIGCQDRKGEIVWLQDSWYICGDFSNGLHDAMNYDDNDLCQYGAEIIGNIHQNKDLLK